MGHEQWTVHHDPKVHIACILLLAINFFHVRGHTDAVLCLQFDNEKVISGSKDTTIKVLSSW